MFRVGGRMTWRRFGVLVRGLPSTSLLQTKLRDTVEFEEPTPGSPERFGPWSTENYQLASLIDAVRELSRLLVQVNSDKPIDPIEPVPRPVLKTRKKANELSEAALDYLQAIRDRHAREAAS